MTQVFSLGLDLRRVVLMTMAVCWTLAVLGLYLTLVSWRASGFSLQGVLAPESLELAWRLLFSPQLTPDRVLLWLAACGLWWLGFGRIITPVYRSLALEISRDDRLDQKGMASASRRLSGLVVGSPVAAMAVFALLYVCVLVWALLAKIPTVAGPLLSALTLPLALAAALVAAAVLLVSIISAPMMPPAAVLECRDLMDVVSRAASYFLQRPFKYLAGLGVKAVMVAVSALAGGAVFLLAWALLYLALLMVGEGELALRAYHLVRRRGDLAISQQFGAVLLAALFYASAIIWAGWLLVISAAADVILYLVMRYDVDGVTFDEIMIPQEHLAAHALTADDTHRQQQAAEAQARAAAEEAKTPN